MTLLDMKAFDRRVVLYPVRFDMIDTRLGGAVVRPGQQAFQVFFFALGEELNAAIRQVAHPARELQGMRHALRIGAEGHALHQAADEKMQLPGG